MSKIWLHLNKNTPASVYKKLRPQNPYWGLALPLGTSISTCLFLLVPVFAQIVDPPLKVPMLPKVERRTVDYSK